MKTLAIYITNSFIKLLHLVKDKTSEFKEYQFDISSLSREEIPYQLNSFLKEKGITSDKLIVIIPRHKVSVRYLSLPAVDKKEIKKMVEYELDNLFPYKKEELVVDETIIETSPDGYSQVMLVVAQRQILDGELLLLKEAGIVPDAVELSSVSLFNQLLNVKKDSGNYLLVNIEDNLSDILLVQEGRLSFSRGVNLKEKEITSELIKEIKEVLDAQGTRDVHIDKIIVSGRETNLTTLASSLEKDLMIACEVNQEISVTKTALLSLSPSFLKIDILPEERKLEKIRNRRRRLLLYMITLFLLNASLIANSAFLKMRQKQQYLQFVNAEISRIETEALDLEKKVLMMQAVGGYLNSGRLTLGLLSELYRITPAGIRFASFDISGQSPQGDFVLRGEAQDTDTVLKFTALIKKSALITSADISYIKKRKIQSGQEVVDFEIKSTF